jgi:hypothetical protein
VFEKEPTQNKIHRGTPQVFLFLQLQNKIRKEQDKDQ